MQLKYWIILLYLFKKAVGNVDRFDFYDEAKKVYCIIATGESAVYANVMLQKGVV